jgi:hypothetical protein
MSKEYETPMADSEDFVVRSHRQTILPIILNISSSFRNKSIIFFL